MKTGLTKFEKGLMKLFADKTECTLQRDVLPCNTCFHNIEGVDFKHIVWLILLELRGDYKQIELLNDIKAQLNKGSD